MFLIEKGRQFLTIRFEFEFEAPLNSYTHPKSNSPEVFPNNLTELMSVCTTELTLLA